MIGRGTQKEIRLAVRAIKAARSHLKNARCGTRSAADHVVLHALQTLEWRAEDLAALAGAPMRKGKKPDVKRREAA